MPQQPFVLQRSSVLVVTIFLAALVCAKRFYPMSPVPDTRLQCRPQVSSLGRYRDSFGAVKSPKPKRNGRSWISVRRRTYALPRVMCWAFYGAPPIRATNISEIYDADHIDGDRTNNVISNLRWLLRGPNAGRGNSDPTKLAKMTATLSRPVLARQVGGDDDKAAATSTWTRFVSAIEAARVLKITSSSISSVANGRGKTATSKATGLRYEFKWAPQNEQVFPDETWRNVVVPDRKVWTETDPATLIQPKLQHGKPVQVSNYGRVRNKSGIYLPTPNAAAYSTLRVCGRMYGVHRLVYFAFVGLPPTSGHVVDHKVERYKAGTYFNRVSNLQALTHADNNRKANRASNGPQTFKPVRGRKVGESDWSIKWKSLTECAKALGRTLTDVSRAIKRGYKRNGYELEYVAVAHLEHEVWKDIPEEMYEEEDRLAALRNGNYESTQSSQ